MQREPCRQLRWAARRRQHHGNRPHLGQTAPALRQVDRARALDEHRARHVHDLHRLVQQMRPSVQQLQGTVRQAQDLTRPELSVGELPIHHRLPALPGEAEQLRCKIGFAHRHGARIHKRPLVNQALPHHHPTYGRRHAHPGSNRHQPPFQQLRHDPLQTFIAHGDIARIAMQCLVHDPIAFQQDIGYVQPLIHAQVTRGRRRCNRTAPLRAQQLAVGTPMLSQLPRIRRCTDSLQKLSRKHR